MTSRRLRFNPPPGWPKPPEGWTPPKGWSPDPSWPDPPPGWQLWLPTEEDAHALDGDQDAPTEVGLDAEEAQSAQRADADVNIEFLRAENAALREELEKLSRAGDVINLDDEHVLQEVGIYRYHHPLENAVAYKEQLSQLGARVVELVKARRAIEVSSMFTFDNSLAKGRRMTNDLGKLMLRAYNAEVDNSIRSLRAGNVAAAKQRVEKSRESIMKLGRMMEMRISDEYHELRIEEIELTADFLMKKQEEKEAAREERARLREERKVQAELAEERKKLDKERAHLLSAIEALKHRGSGDPELERRLALIDEAIAQNDYRAANIRAGYVYVISNRGAFGPNVVKIGLTRRLEPIDRINELSGASVPFRFDVHGLFFSEDAVTLETELHQHFHERRLNHANLRKEFFFASPTEVREACASKLGSLLEFSEQAEAEEYLQSVRYWPDHIRQV